MEHLAQWDFTLSHHVQYVLSDITVEAKNTPAYTSPKDFQTVEYFI